ncbi:MAG: LacI family DNA-binding transcriptional regulator [Anaerolineae bacterium]|nr:LacI family DNA-binding transcriptional regulator [Anaerolineae bacterium]
MANPTKRRVTIRDVAAMAGVSYQTVSRVLNDRLDVADETRQRVKQVMQTLGYQPSAAARSLALKRSHTLGLITSDFSDWFFTQVIVGAEIAVRKSNYYLLLSSTERNPDDEPKYLKLFSEREVDGMLFIRANAQGDSQQMIALSEQGMPIVTTAYDTQARFDQVCVIVVDNIKGGFLATQRLVDVGHRQIGMITGPKKWEAAQDRMLGYRRALEQSGINFDPSLVEHGDWSYDSGYRAMQHLLARAPQITALFAQNDRMAIGAMRSLREAGRKIPGDVAIVGFDDVPAAAFSTPPLTTVRQPMIRIGQIAVELLIQMIENPAQERKEVLLEPELIIRQTCQKSDSTICIS